ncbi:MAG: hypothetical protein E7349_04170 [Clostridiales bacterium]|nr:hypothetical protein [Clostridiales bacterium]
MEKITERQLHRLIGDLETTSLACVVLKNDTGTEYEISGCLVIDMSAFRFYNNGYVISIADKKSRRCRRYDTLIKFLKKEKVLVGDLLTLVSINGRFSTLAEYEEELVFDALDMRGLLKKYEGMADSFVLVGPCEQESLSEEGKELARQEIEKDALERGFAAYQRLSEEERDLLPDFQTLCADIREEIKAYIEENGREAATFICDRQSEGKTRYQKPQNFLWHLYMDLQRLEDFEACSAAVTDSALIAPLDAPLNSEKLRVLKPYLISITPTCSWHCTRGGLSKVYRFRLTEETKNWLLQYKTDYDLDELEDLAFYKGDKLLFSSCTHEGFHSDYSKGLEE